MNLFWIMIVALAVSLAQAVLFNRLGLYKIGYTRHFSKPCANEGDRVELVEIIQNAKLLPVPWLRAESRISPNLRFSRDAVNEERQISANRYHRSNFFLAPFSQIRRRHSVTCLKRGHYEAGSVALAAGDLFALTQREKQLNMPCAIDVYPRLLSEDELDAPCTRWQGDLMVKRWIMPDPFMTSGVRDYRAGDPMRDIHWRATARTGALQVKIRDYTADPRMTVILNVQNSELQWGNLMDYEQEGIEQGIRIAATLCLRALASGVEAGFASNGCLYGEEGSGRCVFLPSRGGLEQSEILLQTMARLEIHKEKPFETYLDSLGDLCGEDILILSTYDSEKIRVCMDNLRRQGNSVTFMQLERGHRNHAESH